ncbi:MAG TPA: hypothetical protein VMV41_10525 [Cellulomonadaceae bacterium]|nr:hypothetical protein [Cellulomonadaceae bacterium]
MPAALVARLAIAGWVPAGRLGAGAHGPAWAVQRSDGLGGRAVVRDLRVGPGRVGACAADLAALRGVENPHIARVLDVLDDGVGGPLVLIDEVSGPTLAALVGARGTLSPGEVVTVVVAVARALTALHGAGLVHGDVAPSNVVIDPSGRPVLIDLWGTVGAEGDLGTPGFASAAVLAGTAPRPADDVHALGRLGLWALGGEATDSGGAVAELLRTVCASAGTPRLTPADLEERCHAASRPEPLRIPDGAALARAEILGGARTCRAVLPTRRRPAPPGVAAGITRAVGAVSRGLSAPMRGPRRTAPAAGPAGGARAAHRAHRARSTVSSRLAMATVLGVCTLTLGGLWLEGLANGTDVRVAASPERHVGGEVSPDPGQTASGATGGAGTATPPDAAAGAAVEPGPVDPADAARHLTGARAQVLISGDSARLAEIDVPGSPAYAADRATLVGLSGSVGSVDGLTCAASAAVVAADATTAVVDVTYELSAHTRRAPGGTVIADVPATPSQTVRLTLGRTDHGWRVSDVAAVG